MVASEDRSSFLAFGGSGSEYVGCRGRVWVAGARGWKVAREGSDWLEGRGAIGVGSIDGMVFDIEVTLSLDAEPFLLAFSLMNVCSIPGTKAQ